MKKVLSVLGILAVIGFATTPAFAAPPHHGGGGHHGAPHQSQIHHHRGKHTPPPRIHRHYHNRGYVSVGGMFARPSYWRHYHGCNCRLGMHHHHNCPYYGYGAYVNVGIPIRF